MKLPQTDIEQKVWIGMLCMLFTVVIIKTLNVPDNLITYALITPLILLGIFCTIAKKKNWISKEKHL